MPSRKDKGDDTRAPGVSADRLPPAPLVLDEDAPANSSKSAAAPGESAEP